MRHFRAGIFSTLAALLLGGAAFAADAPEIELRPVPENLSELPLPDYSLNPYDPNLDWGDGLLEPLASPDFVQRLSLGGHPALVEEFGENIDWIARLDLPLFETPGGAQWGWLTNGRIADLDNGEEFPIPGTMRLRISYDFDTEALFVMEEGADGWVQFRWAGINAPHGGVAWTHPGFQSDPDIGAVYRPWEARFLDAPTRFEYRNADAVHLMRAAPSRDAEIVHRIEGQEWNMEILEIEGDWAHVRVSWPSECSAGGGAQGEVEGWTVWRSEEQGPWIYSPIGGC